MAGYSILIQTMKVVEGLMRGSICPAGREEA